VGPTIRRFVEFLHLFHVQKRQLSGRGHTLVALDFVDRWEVFAMDEERKDRSDDPRIGILKDRTTEEVRREF